MTDPRSRPVWSLALATTLALSLTAFAAPPKTAKKPAPAKPAPRPVATPAADAPLTEQQRIVHVLNRLGFGPRPGDVERIQKLGLSTYIDQQLNPERIDDSRLDTKLADYSVVGYSAVQLGQMEEAVRRNGAKMIRKAAEQRAQMAAAGKSDPSMTADPQGPPQERERRAILDAATPAERQEMQQARQMRLQLNDAGREFVQDKLIRAAESQRQLQEVMVDFWSNHFNIDMNKTRLVKIADEREVIRRHALGKFRDLLGASAKSPAMLIYLDNFQSVAPQPVPGVRLDRQQITWSQLQAAAARGNASARQAMEQLTAAGITTEEAFNNAVRNTRAAGRQQRGLNENYARELLELHTLGVDGGYTQKDVQEVARCLTGWTINGGRYGGEFYFNARLHDNGEKLVLGKTIAAGGGMLDGEAVLDLLASHPSTRRFLSTKLCRRFVSDTPPASLIDKCVATWEHTDGDIRAVVGTIVTSPEFFARSAYRQKIKSPFEYAVSCVRALGAEVDTKGQGGLALGNNGGARPGNPRTLEGQINILGQPLFRYAFPTGWPEDSQKWVSAGALISRLNYTLALVDGNVGDVVLTGGATAAAGGRTGESLVDAMTGYFLHGDVSPATRATLMRQARVTPGSAEVAQIDSTRRLAALVLGSPEFQRR